MCPQAHGADPKQQPLGRVPIRSEADDDAAGCSEAHTQTPATEGET
jgi:hypothetical protein